MAYCKRCGAYIPEGLTACLACGYDEEGERAQAAARAAAKEEEKRQEREQAAQPETPSDKFRAQYEENRRRQQEQSRRWAEQEYRRREAQRADEERQAAYRARAYHAAETEKSAADTDSGRLWGVLSYVGLLGVIPYVTGAGGEDARFHAGQSFRLAALGLLTRVLFSSSLVGIGLRIARIGLAIRGMDNALHDRTEPLPYIGSIGRK